MEPWNSTYQYAPLAPVRLLHIYRRPDFSIGGQLRNFCLDSPDCPRFTTLSYVWGPASYTNAIWLDGHLFPVLDNLYPVLVAFCDAEEFQDDYWLWIDSICINQRDPQERASQVQLMKRIYAQSARTVAWLGGETPEVAEGMEFMAHLADQHLEIVEFSTSNNTREVPPQLRLHSKWKSLGRFLDMQWWKRMWTLQEYVIARELDLYCGSRRVSESTVEGALSAIWYCLPDNSLLQSESWTRAWSRHRLRQWYQEDGYSDNMGLIALLAYTSSCELSDPRDRIYGLLGLAKEADRVMVGRPTYLDSVEAIYMRLVASFIETYGSLDIICFAQIFRRPDNDNTTDFDSTSTRPSWVPDWRVHIEPFVTPLMVSQTSGRHIGNFRPLSCEGWEGDLSDESYRADAGMKYQATLDIQSGRLGCKGYFVDFIDGLGSVLRSPHHSAGQQMPPITQSSSVHNRRRQALDFLQNHSTTRTESRNFLTEVVRCLTLDREDRYLAHPAPGELFRDQLLGLVEHLRDIDSQCFPASYQSALAWFQANKDLLLRGRTLEELCLDSMDPESPINLETEVSEESFTSRLIDCTAPLKMQRGLMVTDGGAVGMAPCHARKGDVVCILLGCSVPVVLRKIDDGGQECYRFIGECYVHGIMNGEFIGRERVQRDFVLI